jgi:excisionase family DNA binding protein
METIIITNEEDIKRWVREAVREELKDLLAQSNLRSPAHDEPLLTRKEIANYLNVSLVTLTEWVRHGLPCIRKGRRVLFLKSEVLVAMKRSTVKQAAKTISKQKRCI